MHSVSAGALIANGVALVLDATASIAHATPTFSLGVSGFGGTPKVDLKYGGENVGRAATSSASVARGIAGLLSEGGQIAATLGGYNRRSEEWDWLRREADQEMEQLDSSIDLANEGLTKKTAELQNHYAHIANAQKVDDFLKQKYTKADLYDYMLGQVKTLHTQACMLLVELAKKANLVYNYELGTNDQFIDAGGWDGDHGWLLVAERVLFDLRRMEASYVESNVREMELSKQVSLALTQPLALVRLRETGTCDIELPEELFDRDYPGQYFRRLSSVSVTIPCVVGPLTSVNATLRLNSSSTRVSPEIGSSGYRRAKKPAPDARFKDRAGQWRSDCDEYRLARCWALRGELARRALSAL